MRLSLKAKVLALAVVPVLLFAVVISLTTVWILQGQARNEVDETRQRLLNDAKTTLRGYVEVARADVPPSVAGHAQFRSLCPASARCLARPLA